MLTSFNAIGAQREDVQYNSRLFSPLFLAYSNKLSGQAL